MNFATFASRKLDPGGFNWIPRHRVLSYWLQCSGECCPIFGYSFAQPGCFFALFNCFNEIPEAASLCFFHYLSIWRQCVFVPTKFILARFLFTRMHPMMKWLSYLNSWLLIRQWQLCSGLSPSACSFSSMLIQPLTPRWVLPLLRYLI